MKRATFPGTTRRGRRLRGLLAAIPVLLLVATTLGVDLSPPLHAAPPPPTASETIAADARQQVAALLAEKDGRTPVQHKIDSNLLYAVKKARGEAVSSAIRSVDTDVAIANDGTTEVDLTATVSKPLLQQLANLGATIISVNSTFRSIRARVPLAAIEAVAVLRDVIFVQPKQIARLANPSNTSPSYLPGFDARAAHVREQLTGALTHIAQNAITASNVSEGDVTHRAKQARSTYGLSGRGVKIGVLSDGVSSLASLQASGDLPPNVTVLPGQAGSGNEGSAMLEIVHDLAPNAQLYFATGYTSIASFAQNILDLRAAGCDIIVDDLTYYVETPFQQGQASSIVSTTNGGVVAEAVNRVSADGALYFSAAINSGNMDSATSGTWEGDFADAGAAASSLGSSGNVQDFDASSAVVGYNVVTQSSPSGVIDLFWSDPLGASANDYDLFAISADGTRVLASSTNLQNGRQDPYEQIYVDLPVGARLVVVKRSGAAARFLHLDTNGGRLRFSTPGSTRGHAASVAAFGIAATPASVAYGGSPNPLGPYPGAFSATNSVEMFSSDGPRRFFYKADGSPITPGNLLAKGGTSVQKPDLTAADGVSCAAPGFSPFFGTSAAAPHAAAIAALLKSANRTFTPAQMRSFLTSSAIDIASPGVDRTSGAGIVDALAAVQASRVTPQPQLVLGSVQATPSAGDGDDVIEPSESATLRVPLNNTGVRAATAVNAILTTTTPGVTIVAGVSAYPSIAINGTQSSTTPFLFALSRTVRCGERIDFTLTVTFEGATLPQALHFTVQTGKAGTAATTIAYRGAAVDIPDGDAAGINIPIAVSGLQGNVSDINFSIDGSACSTAVGSASVGLSHSWVGDLVLTLTSPGGKTITLIGPPEDGSPGSSGHNFCQTVLDDQNTDVSIDTIASDGAPYTGRFLPHEPLATFNAEPADGIWTLHVADRARGETGVMRAFSLSITTYEPCDAAANAMTISATNGGAQSVPINTPFEQHLQATVVDTSGKPIPDVAVTFTAPTNGAGGIFPAGNVATTDSSGQARVAFSANATAGSYTVTANTDPPLAAPAAFRLTNTSGAPASLVAVAGTSQSTGLGTTFENDLRVVVRDAGGNPVSGVTVTFTAPADGASGTFSEGNTAITDVDGQAWVVFSANSTAGAYSVTASIDAALAAPVRFELVNTSDTPEHPTNAQRRVYLPIVVKSES